LEDCIRNYTSTKKITHEQYFICLFAAPSFTTVTTQNFYTVSNNPNFNAKYTSLQAAHDAVAAGSTLYLMPSQKALADNTHLSFRVFPIIHIPIQ
jgi:hypothetical protein